MDAIPVLLTRRRTLGSVLIRAFTWSAWSHVEVVDGEHVIGASMGAGVHVTPLADRLARSSYAAVVWVPCQSAEAVISRIRSQLGKPYDYAALLGIATRQRRLNMPKAWFCSELVAWAFEQAGSPIFRQGLSGRIVPADFWKLPLKDHHSANPLELAGYLWG